jgi:predicted nucleic acid-binding protein
VSDHAFDRYEFAPSSPGPTALFLDSSALIAYFDAESVQHDVTTAFVGSILGEQPRFAYRPLFTNTYVVDEVATRLQSGVGRTVARDALEHVFSLSDDDHLRILPETWDEFLAARDGFCAYDDHAISFTDHLVVEQSRRRDIDHVLAFDDDFRTFGLEVLPRSS